MKTNQTDGNEGQGSSTITGLDNVTKENEVPFDLGGLGGTEPSAKTQAELDAEKATKEAADKLAADEAAKIAAAGGTETSTEDETFFEFEDKKFKLDDKGNALNEDGTIFKTKEELDAITAASDSTELPPLIEEVIQLNGVQILDEQGKPKVYEDSTAGLIAYAKDYAKMEVENSQKEFFKQFPQARELAAHLMNGGKEDEFYRAKTASWKNVAIDETNEAQQVDVITKDLLAKGFSKEEVAEHIALYKDSNKLLEKSKASLESHRKAEDAADKAKIENDKKAQIEYDAKVEAHWKAVETTIKTGKLEHITIPEADKDAFFKYIAFGVDKNGNSQYELDEMNDKLESDLQYKYLRFKKFDLGTLIKNTAATVVAGKLRDRIKDTKENNNGGGSKPTEKVSPNEVVINLSSVIGT